MVGISTKTGLFSPRKGRIRLETGEGSKKPIAGLSRVRYSDTALAPSARRWRRSGGSFGDLSDCRSAATRRGLDSRPQHARAQHSSNAFVPVYILRAPTIRPFGL